MHPHRTGAGQHAGPYRNGARKSFATSFETDFPDLAPTNLEILVLMPMRLCELTSQYILKSLVSSIIKRSFMKTTSMPAVEQALNVPSTTDAEA